MRALEMWMCQYCALTGGAVNKKDGCASETGRVFTWKLAPARKPE